MSLKSNSLFGLTEIPAVLRSLSKEDAVDNARHVAQFLQDATESMATNEVSSKENAYGMYICFSLLKDYLDIAAGEYDSFMVTISDNASFRSDKKEGAQ